MVVELFHLAPLELLCHVDIVSPKRMGDRRHVADRAPPVRFGELDLASKREVFFGATPAAFDGIFDKPPRKLIDAFPIGSRHPGNGACARGGVRHDEQLAGTEVHARHIPAEELIATLARRRQRPQAAHLPDLVSQADFHG